jgi:transketolase
VQDHFQHRFTHLKTKVQEWNESLSSVQNNKDFAQLWTQVMEGNLPELDFPEFDDGVSLATRKAFGITLEKFAEHLPNILGGSADLEPSNCTGGFAK